MTFSTSPLTSALGLDRPVLEVMHVGVVSVPAHLPLAAAARAMAEHRVHAVLVVDDTGGPLGWVTSRGMLHNLPRDWGNARAGDAISETLISVAPTDHVARALEAFLASGASHILVRTPNTGRILGVVAESDLLVVLAGEA